MAKYASSDGPIALPTVQISGKTVEETGYDKIASRQSKLDTLTTVILDGHLIACDLQSQVEPLASLTPEATTVDIGFNLFGTLEEASLALGRLSELRSLSLEGNRLRTFACSQTFSMVRSLNVDDMLLTPEELNGLLNSFSSLEELSASANLLSKSGNIRFPVRIQELTLSGNAFTDLSALTAWLSSSEHLLKLVLKNNRIAQIVKGPRTAHNGGFPSCLEELDLSFNEISSWSFLDDLSTYAPGLTRLRITGNPVYRAQTRPNGKIVDESQISMIVIARMTRLKMLNFTAIADKDRLNAEMYYLSLIVEELSNAPEAEAKTIIACHPRYAELCEEYGAPSIERAEKNAYPPNSIAAQLISLRIYVSNPPHSAQLPTRESPEVVEIPQSFTIYNVYGLVGRHFGLVPSCLRLIWETGERDPPDRGMAVHAAVVEEWDSEEEEAGPSASDWVDREVELERGTRPLLTVVEAREAVIRAEIRSDAKHVLLSDFVAQRSPK